MVVGLDSKQMKKLLKPLLTGLACGGVAFLSSEWATDVLLLHYYGFDRISTDPDYHAAIAMGTMSCFVDALICGAVIGLATAVLTTRNLLRRNKARRSEASLSHS